jgi:general secretion pathway protein F
MAGFRYSALTSDGRRQKGVLEAAGARQARAWLRDQGLTPIEVEAIGAGPRADRSRRLFRRGLGTTQLAILTRQLATLLASGLTVEQTLNALIEQAETETERQLLAGIRGDVLSGQTLARAIGNQGSLFPDLYRTLVEAGERSGKLPEVLARLADYTEERDALRAKVALAFIYPTLITVVAVLVVGGLVTYVVPQVVQVFRNTHQALPLLTRALIGLSDLLRAIGVYLIIALVAFAFFVRQSLRAPAVRTAWHATLLRLPVVGALVRGLNTERLASTLAILTSSKVPLLSALRAGAGVVANLPMRQAIIEAAQFVQEGATLSRALGASKLFPPLMVHMIASGEIEVGFQQVSELKPVKGITLVGPIPSSVQLITPFTAAISSKSANPEAAKQLIAFLTSPKAYDAIKAAGLVPAAIAKD